MENVLFRLLDFYKVTKKIQVIIFQIFKSRLFLFLGERSGVARNSERKNKVQQHASLHTKADPNRDLYKSHVGHERAFERV